MIPTTRASCRQSGRAIAGPDAGDGLLRVPQIHVQRLRIAVDKYRNAALVPNHFGGRGKGHRRHENAVAGANTKGANREVQSRRAGIQGDGVRCRELPPQRLPRIA